MRKIQNGVTELFMRYMFSFYTFPHYMSSACSGVILLCRSFFRSFYCT